MEQSSLIEDNKQGEVPRAAEHQGEDDQEDQHMEQQEHQTLT